MYNSFNIAIAISGEGVAVKWACDARYKRAVGIRHHGIGAASINGDPRNESIIMTRGEYSFEAEIVERAAAAVSRLVPE